MKKTSETYEIKVPTASGLYKTLVVQKSLYDRIDDKEGARYMILDASLNRWRKKEDLIKWLHTIAEKIEVMA